MKKILGMFKNAFIQLGEFLIRIEYVKRIFPVLLIVCVVFAYLLAWLNSEDTYSKFELMQLLQQNEILGDYAAIDTYEKLEFVDNSELDSLTDFYNEDFRQHNNYICFYICDSYKNAGKLESYLLNDKEYFYVYKHKNIVFYTNSAATFNKFATIIDNLV